MTKTILKNNKYKINFENKAEGLDFGRYDSLG